MSGNKKRIGVLFLISFLIFSMFPIPIGSQQGVIMATTSEVLKGQGVHGMEIDKIRFETSLRNIDVNSGNTISLAGKSFKFDTENLFTKIDSQNIKHEIDLRKLDSFININFNFTTIIEIKYNQIMWNGTIYNLNATPIKMMH